MWAVVLLVLVVPVSVVLLSVAYCMIRGGFLRPLVLSA